MKLEYSSNRKNSIKTTPECTHQPQFLGESSVVNKMTAHLFSPRGKTLHPEGPEDVTKRSVGDDREGVELDSEFNTDKNTEDTENIIEPESEEEIEKTLVRLAALIAIIWTKERQQPPDPEEESMLAKSIRPKHSIVKALDDQQVKRILFSFAIIFCFSSAAEHITASMLQENPLSGDKGETKFVVFLAKNGGVHAQAGDDMTEEKKQRREGVTGEGNKEEMLRKDLLAWFNGTGAIDKTIVVQHCSDKVMKDAKNSKNSLEKGRKAFKESNVYESGEKIASDIKRLCDAINGGQAEKLVQLAQTWIAKHEELARNIYNELDISKVTDKNRKEAIGRCLDAIEDLILLPRALENLELFRDTVRAMDANLDIQFVDIDTVSKVPVKEIQDEIDKIEEEMNISFKDVSVDNFLREFNAHGEIKLLTHLHKMSPAEREQMWKFIACSKLPCFCCFYLIHNAEGYATEKSHYKVYYPWPLPPELTREPGYLEGIEGLIERLEQRVRRACTVAGDGTGDAKFESLEKISETPWRLLSPPRK